MKDSVLWVTWHGSGDLVMSINSFIAYKKKYPNVKVGVATLKNRGNVSVELLSPHVDEVFPLLSEPWDWPEKYNKPLQEGRKVVMQEAEKIATDNNYSDFIEITMSQLISPYKPERVAIEMGVYPLDNYIPTIDAPQFSIDSAIKRIESLPKPVVLFHGVGGDINKTLSSIAAKEFLKGSNAGTVIECGSSMIADSVYYKPETIEGTCALIKACDCVYCIDSLVMHLSVALGAETNVLFTKTTPRLIFGNKIPNNVKFCFLNG